MCVFDQKHPLMKEGIFLVASSVPEKASFREEATAINDNHYVRLTVVGKMRLI